MTFQLYFHQSIDSGKKNSTKVKSAKRFCSYVVLIRKRHTRWQVTNFLVNGTCFISKHVSACCNMHDESSYVTNAVQIRGIILINSINPHVPSKLNRSSQRKNYGRCTETFESPSPIPRDAPLTRSWRRVYVRSQLLPRDYKNTMQQLLLMTR